jgi:hypothetical protein
LDWEGLLGVGDVRKEGRGRVVGDLVGSWVRECCCVVQDGRDEREVVVVGWKRIARLEEALRFAARKEGDQEEFGMVVDLSCGAVCVLNLTTES